MEEDVTTKLGSVIYPVAKMEHALDFYSAVFGLNPRFVDGDRFAVFDTGGPKFALASGSERIADTPAAAFAVNDVASTLRRIEEAGGIVVSGPDSGPHEVRAVARDRWGNAIVIYSRD